MRVCGVFYMHERMFFSATTDKINNETEGQFLGFTVNDGQEVTLKELEVAGYTVEFQANKDVFKTSGADSNTSKTGEIAKTDFLSSNISSFRYMVGSIAGGRGGSRRNPSFCLWLPSTRLWPRIFQPQ